MPNSDRLDAIFPLRMGAIAPYSCSILIPGTSIWSNHSTAWLMRHRLGLRAVLMDLMAGVEIKGDEAMIETLAQFSKHNASHVKGILNLTIPLDESPIWILGQFLSQLETWGKRGSVINVEMRRYRESVLAGLVEDGYTIIDAPGS